MTKLSASSIEAYEKCPKKYEYRYIIKPDVPIQDWSHLEFGKFAHRALELFHMHLMDNVCSPNEYANIMSTSFKKTMKEFKGKLESGLISEVKDVIQDYLNVIRVSGLPYVIGTEKEFSFKVEEFTVRGLMDRVDRISETHLKVVDYKTNKNPKYLTDFQLLLYALALKDQMPDIQRIDGAYILLKHKSREKGWSFGPADLERARDKILRVGRDIDLGVKWEKRPSILCNWCDYQEICEGKKKGVEKEWTEEIMFK